MTDEEYGTLFQSMSVYEQGQCRRNIMKVLRPVIAKLESEGWFSLSIGEALIAQGVACIAAKADREAAMYFLDLAIDSTRPLKEEEAKAKQDMKQELRKRFTIVE